MASESGNLYGIRPARKEASAVSSSTSLAFTSSLTSLLSASSTTSRTSAGRPRPSKTKSDIFTAHNKNAKKRAAKDLEDNGFTARAGRQDIGGVDESVLHRSKRKMEEKAKMYRRMKRGEMEGQEGEGGADGLIDFDRKWAERRAKGEASSSDDDVESDDGQGEMVDYEDEYGRVRRGTKAEAERMERRKQNKVLGAEELDRMSARPAMPGKIIYGDTVQVMAFNPDEVITEKMEEIARKRDRSMTPPEAKHYEADKEMRGKGVGFYSFSKDEKTRMSEMEALEKERGQTERVRREREEKKEERRREVEERRRVISEKRARRQADSFLEDLGAEIRHGGEDKKEKEIAE